MPTNEESAQRYAQAAVEWAEVAFSSYGMRHLDKDQARIETASACALLSIAHSLLVIAAHLDQANVDSQFRDNVALYMPSKE